METTSRRGVGGGRMAAEVRAHRQRRVRPSVVPSCSRCLPERSCRRPERSEGPASCLRRARFITIYRYGCVLACVSHNTLISMSTRTIETHLDLGRSIARRRIARGLSQKDLARLAGVGVTSLQRLEGGRGGQVATLVRVVTALGAESWLTSLAPAPTTTDGADAALRERRRVFAPRVRRPRGAAQADGA